MSQVEFTSRAEVPCGSIDVVESKGPEAQRACGAVKLVGGRATLNW
jgi:hypothetical protein